MKTRQGVLVEIETAKAIALVGVEVEITMGSEADWVNPDSVTMKKIAAKPRVMTKAHSPRRERRR